MSTVRPGGAGGGEMRPDADGSMDAKQRSDAQWKRSVGCAVAVVVGARGWHPDAL
eukprot:CAMPEP_0181302980 /NCGR_PEP_ID=MMETSP1101-20121128/8299_1 /TAXON_ID=46948 /ORGANISM="Rhodomonas abbreviata, Strain Caron Lab Isolate" /LENGTH=54 /DNA_ID=CAMNT_0023408493 /DNA_START=398 /DNA_END=562 /DNA_ORIENTATION=-